jgi:hypothetical protein
MGFPERVYNTAWGRVKPPIAKGDGNWNRLTRLRLLQEGIEACLATCPRSERVVATHLQQAWVETAVARQRETAATTPEQPPLIAGL